MDAEKNYLIREHLKNIIKLRGDFPRDRIRHTPEQLVLDHGMFFRPAKLPSKYKAGVKTYCFYNSYVLASRSRGNLTYCEGYALGEFFPMHHAWCVDRHGCVVDVTWDNPESCVYMGVPIKIDIARRIYKSTSLASMLDNYQDRYFLKTDPAEFIEISCM